MARLRMSNACKLLAENKKMTVQEAAFESGFKSMNTFYRNYQK
ncbi:MAG: helix-turn-helix domain-containing protein [Lachnospiraceae bacterium]